MWGKGGGREGNAVAMHHLCYCVTGWTMVCCYEKRNSVRKRGNCITPLKSPWKHIFLCCKIVIMLSSHLEGGISNWNAVCEAAGNNPANVFLPNKDPPAWTGFSSFSSLFFFCLTTNMHGVVFSAALSSTVPSCCCNWSWCLNKLSVWISQVVVMIEAPLDKNIVRQSRSEAITQHSGGSGSSFRTSKTRCITCIQKWQHVVVSFTFQSLSVLWGEKIRHMLFCLSVHSLRVIWDQSLATCSNSGSQTLWNKVKLFVHNGDPVVVNFCVIVPLIALNCNRVTTRHKQTSFWGPPPPSLLFSYPRVCRFFPLTKGLSQMFSHFVTIRHTLWCILLSIILICGFVVLKLFTNKHLCFWVNHLSLLLHLQALWGTSLQALH